MTNLLSTATVPQEALLKALMAESAAHHQHLCPRQVLGIRMGLYGLRRLGIAGSVYAERFRNSDKRLLTIVETDGCGADGISVATACYVGRRTLRVLDYGKMAATVVDTETGLALRITPRARSRELAQCYAPQAPSRWHAYRDAYQIIPDDELLRAQPVKLTQSIAAILSRPDARVLCEQCGEEVMNEREVQVGSRTLCQSCAGESYYRLSPA